jgi:hypothetical protein
MPDGQHHASCTNCGATATLQSALDTANASAAHLDETLAAVNAADPVPVGALPADAPRADAPTA